MKSRSLLLLLSIFLLVGFKHATKKEMQLEQLERKSIIGDFDGDKKADTLFEIHTSGEKDSIITEIPFIDDYDKTVDYYFKNSIRTSLKSSNKKIKELDLDVKPVIVITTKHRLNINFILFIIINPYFSKVTLSPYCSGNHILLSPFFVTTLFSRQTNPCICIGTI